jgi:hypothetical protein
MGYDFILNTVHLLGIFLQLVDEIRNVAETGPGRRIRNPVIGQSGLPEYAIKSERTCRQDHVPATRRRR